MTDFTPGQTVKSRITRGDLVSGHSYEIVKTEGIKMNANEVVNFCWVKGDDTNNVLTLVPEKDLTV